VIRLRALARIVIGVEFGAAVAIIVYAGVHDFHDVFQGAPPAVRARISASCDAAGESGSCGASLVELNPGRYRIVTSTSSARLRATLTADDPRRARYLLVRLSQPANVRLAIEPRGEAGPEGVVGADGVDLSDAGRVVIPLAVVPSVTLSFVPMAAGPSPASSAASVAPATPIKIDELGVFEQRNGLLRDVRPVFRAIPPARYHGMLVPRAIAALCLFTIAAAVFLPAGALKRYSPLILPFVCFSLCLLDLAILFSPYFGHDLRTFYAAGDLSEPPGTNLNGGLHQGFRLLTGRGLTLMDGAVAWERMPGYALFCAAAGILFGHRTLLDLALSTVLLQTISYSAAVGLFAWAAGPLFPPAAVWAVGLLMAWLPKQLGLTQVDALIAPSAILVVAALCLRLTRTRDGRGVPVALDVLVHLTFAIWFAMRPDVLPGWLLVSLALHWKHWRRLLIPAVFFLAIGGTWGAYKARYTGEFALTTTSAGASLFCGLWEVPSRFRFAEACRDETYFDWIHQNTPYQPQSTAANSFATREVVKFWLTYPGHLVIMVAHKLMQTLDGDLWPGYQTQLQVFVFGAVRRYWIVLSLATIVALCAAFGYQRERTLLLGWPLFFNAPIFWVMFASLGRFYSAVGIALLAAAVPPIFERDFYAALRSRPRRAISVVACAALFAIVAWPFHDWLLRQDGLHYWTPLLDPAASRLSAFK